MTATLAELANRIGVSPADILESLTSIGHVGYWLNGNRFRDSDDLQQGMSWADEVGEVEIDLTGGEQRLLADAWGVAASELSREVGAK